MIYNILFSGLDGIQKFLLILAFLLTAYFAICLHEYAHGFVAEKMGDSTARAEGRLTLNPMVHFEPIGLVMFLLVGFGFARPVPVNPYNFRNLRKGLFLTAFAGVIMNLIQALVGFGMLVGFGYLYYTNATASVATQYLLFFLLYFSLYVTMLNVALIAFNLLPIYPLDGFRVVESLTPFGNPYVRFMRRYGQYILIAIVILGFLFERVGLAQGNIFGMYIGAIQKGILKLFDKILEVLIR